MKVNMIIGAVSLLVSVLPYFVLRKRTEYVDELEAVLALWAMLTALAGAVLGGWALCFDDAWAPTAVSLVLATAVAFFAGHKVDDFSDQDGQVVSHHLPMPGDELYDGECDGAFARTRHVRHRVLCGGVAAVD